VSDALVLDLHVQPGAKAHRSRRPARRSRENPAGSAASGWRGERRARAFRAEAFGVPKRNVEIVSGATSRQKRVRITGATMRPSWV
jgi:uncharacterized protein YggU (UPF0235/DUF167 family)